VGWRTSSVSVARRQSSVLKPSVYDPDVATTTKPEAAGTRHGTTPVRCRAATSRLNTACPAPAKKRRPLWDLRDSDRRLLFVTIVGGLAANVGLVLIVGLGLTAASFFTTFGDGFFFLLMLAMVAALGALVMLVMRLTKQPIRNMGGCLFIIFGLAWAVIAVALIGYAAGIK
jgi:predicted lipid-binding transport protein (Tim44 family)